MSEIDVARIGDMHHERCLRIRTQRDGDIIITIEQNGLPIGDLEIGDPDQETALIEFCLSGGRSNNVREALFTLIEAIQKDNQQHPI